MFDDALSIAREAGEIVLSYFKKPIRLSQKPDRSPVSEADIESDRFIRNALTRRFDLPVISEETETPYEERIGWTRFWLVDPLDGSKEFIHGNEEFAINIALIEEGRPVLGVIHAPALQQTFYTQTSGGAFWIRDNKKIPLPCETHTEFIIATSRFHHNEQANQFAQLNGISRTVTAGSSLKFGHIASGKINVYPRYTGSMEWDIAAGHIIVKEAGGSLIDLKTGHEPAYNKPSLKNNSFICCGCNIDPRRFKGAFEIVHINTDCKKMKNGEKGASLDE